MPLFDFTTGVLPPGATLTRASAALYMGGSPASLISAGIDVPRFQTNPSTDLVEGILNEPAFTNGIRNSSMVGTVAGTPGTAPTNWIVTTTTNGLTRTIVGTGTEDGITYIDVRFAGTSVSASSISFNPEGTATGPAAAVGQNWYSTFYLRLVGGTTTGFILNGMYQYVTERDATNVALFNAIFYTQLTSAPLKTQRLQSLRTLTFANTAKMTHQVTFAYSATTAIDITFRVGLPQLGQSPFVNSPVITTTVAATVAADVLKIPLSDGTYQIDIVTPFGTKTFLNQQPTAGLYTVPYVNGVVSQINAIKTAEATFDFSNGYLPFEATTSVVRSGSAWHFGSPNYLKNPYVSDVMPGPLSNGGSLPTSWQQASGMGGNAITSVTILGYGIEDGIPYVDIKWQGTNIASSYSLNFEYAASVPAIYGQVWTCSVYVKLLDGNFTGIPISATSPRLTIRSQSTGGIAGDSIHLVTNAPLKSQKFSVTGAPTDAGITSIVPLIYFTTTNGAAVNLSLRFGLPWLTPTIPVLYTDTANTPRFHTNPATSVFGGLLNEPTATNSLRNSNITGAVAGVHGTSTGTLPTNWLYVDSGATGVVWSIVATGVEDGIPYVDIRHSGTPSITSATAWSFEVRNFIPATLGQTWTLSAYGRLIAGNITGLASLNITNRESSGSGSGTLASSNVSMLTVTSAALRTQRFDIVRPYTNASTTLATSQFSIGFTSGVAFDITVRVGLPQFGQATAPTSPIVTTTAAVTRAIENITLPVRNATYDVDIITSISVTKLFNQVVSGGNYAVPTTTEFVRNVILYETGGYDFSSGAMPSKAVIDRPGTGWTFGPTVNLTAYTANQPRFRYNVVSSTCEGLLNEAASTNGVRNSVLAGAVAGVIGSGGALPTNWVQTGSSAGFTREVIGSGVEDGINYVDIRVFGTPSNTATIVWTYDSTTQIPALNGEVWNTSCFVKLIAGSATSGIAGIRTVIYNRDSGGGGLQSWASYFVPTTAALKTQRQQINMTITNASSAYITGDFRIDYVTGGALDITFRLGNPVVEMGTEASSPIITTGTAVTRPKSTLGLVVNNGKYDITVNRVVGPTLYSDVIVSTGAYVVPNSSSPVVSATFGALVLAAANGVGDAVGRAYRAINSKGSALGAGNASSISGFDNRVRGDATGIGYAEGNTYNELPPPIYEEIQYWQGYPGPAGYLDIPTWGLFPISNITAIANLRETRGFAYLLRLIIPNKASGTEVYTTIYLAASMGRSTTPDDIPPSTYVPGILLNSTINYAVSFFSGIEPLAESKGGQGAIVLMDPRGTLDSLINESWDGAKLDILQGPPTAKFRTYQLVDKLTTAGILYNQRKKEIRLRDQAWKLQQANLHDQIYAGTGGIEGPIELKGIYKPYGVGVVKNIEPTLINSALQIRQLSCSSVLSIDEVRDGGVVIFYTGDDYPDYAALAAAANVPGTIPAGYYSSCLAQGLLATGSKPFFMLTCDMHGDADQINGTGYVDTIATICRRIATGRGNVKLLDGELDFISLSKLDQIQSDECGWWWNDNVTKADALTQIMNSRLGWWCVLMNGLTAFGVMDEPTADPAMVINYPTDFSAEPEQLDTYQVPRSQTYIGYNFNYTRLSPSQLAGSIDAATIALYAQDSLWANQASTVPIWKQATAQVVKVQSGFVDLIAAQTEAIRQQTIMGVRRERWTISTPCAPFSDILGKVVQVNNFPRYNWGVSRKFICIGISFASGIAVKLTLWG